MGNYGLTVRYCFPPGPSIAKVTAADIEPTEEAGRTKVFARVMRALKRVGVGLKHTWKEGKQPGARIRTPGAGVVEVTAASGHFDVCMNPLSDLFTAFIGISQRAF